MQWVKPPLLPCKIWSGKIQLYVARDNLPEGVYAEDVGNWDLGDIIGVKGTLFKTKTNELTIKTTEVQLLTKSTSSVTKQIPWFNRQGSPLSSTLLRFNF